LCDQILLDFEGIGLVAKLRKEKKKSQKEPPAFDSATSITT